VVTQQAKAPAATYASGQLPPTPDIDRKPIDRALVAEKRKNFHVEHLSKTQ